MMDSFWLGRAAHHSPWDSEPPTFKGARKFLWLSEGLMEPETAGLFEAALPEDIRALCQALIRALHDDLEAELGKLDDG